MVRAKALIEADELGSLARVQERSRRLCEYTGLFDDPALINTLLPRYLAITAEQLRDVARSVFRADNRVVLTYVPLAGAEVAVHDVGDEVVTEVPAGPVDAAGGTSGADADEETA
jgi:hypothetical protein